MSNTITHLAVAAEIAKMNKNLIHNLNAFYLGSIAPDAIGSKNNCTRRDKKLVHLREEISDLKWLEPSYMNLFNQRVQEFVNYHINCEKIEENQKDFNIGYLVHLLTDKWNHMTIRQSMIKHAFMENIEENDKAFFYMMKNDLEALDQYLLETRNYIKDIFYEICNSPVNYCLSGYIEKEYIEKSILWWKYEYVTSIKTRKLKYLLPKEIDIFIENTSNEILKELKRLIK